MGTKTLTTFRVCALAVFLVAGSGPVFAGGAAEKEARALFKEATRLTDSGDYVGALELYRGAYARWPNPKILLNTATVLMLLGRDAEAADTFEQYLRDPLADPKMVPEVRKTLAEREKLIGKLRIEADVPGLAVRVDGKPVGQSGAALVVRVTPGEHTVSAQVAGRPPVLETVTVAAGEARDVVLKTASPGTESPAGKPANSVAGASSGQPAKKPPGMSPLGKPGGTSEGTSSASKSQAGVTATPADRGGVASGAGVTLHSSESGSSQAEPASTEGSPGAEATVASRAVPGRERRFAGTIGLRSNGLGDWPTSAMGASVRVLSRCEIVSTLLWRPRYPKLGFDVRWVYEVLPGSFRPTVAIGVPVLFTDDRTTIGVLGAVGVRWNVSERLALLADVHGSYFAIRPSDVAGPGGRTIQAGAVSGLFAIAIAL
ncbi:MAG: tetratricopeptide repeat protein [Pseudomonadota bacterium]